MVRFRISGRLCPSWRAISIPKACRRDSSSKFEIKGTFSADSCYGQLHKVKELYFGGYDGG